MSRRSRRQLSKAVRFDVLKRDSFACTYCGARPPHAVLHVDHIKPVADGGGNHMSNLVAACADCNLGKSDRRLMVTREHHEEVIAGMEEDSLFAADYAVNQRLGESADYDMKGTTRAIHEAYERGVRVPAIMYVSSGMGASWEEWRKSLERCTATRSRRGGA